MAINKKSLENLKPIKPGEQRALKAPELRKTCNIYFSMTQATREELNAIKAAEGIKKDIGLLDLFLACYKESKRK